MVSSDDIVRISSLSEYLGIVEKKHLNNCFSRGERKDNKATKMMATALRNFSLDWTENVKDYKFEIAHRLSDLQNKYFLAFAQHHQVNTNLLDFSSSPLVSLYFATRLFDDDKDKENGFVYFISKSKFGNFNSLIGSIDSSAPLLDAIFDWDTGVINELISILYPIYIKNIFDFSLSFIKLFKYVLKYFIAINYKVDKVNDLFSRVDKIEKEVKYELVHNRYNVNAATFQPEILNIATELIELFRYQTDMVGRIINIFDEIASRNDTSMVMHRPIYVYLIVLSLWYYIRLFHNEMQFFDNFSLPFYLLYNIPVIDERFQNQSSLLMYQIWSLSGACQIIEPEFTIEVCDKVNIQRQLDHIGINEKFIFCDYDHIGHYFNNKTHNPFYVGI